MDKEVEQLNRAEQERRRADLTATGQRIDAHDFKTVRGEVSIAAGERVQFYETDRKLGVATSEFGTVKAVSPSRMEIAKDDGNTVTLDPVKYDKWGLGYSGTGYKGQGKTQVKTAAVYDNPYVCDSRASYVIGTRHRDEYQLFVPHELAPDLATLSGQIMRQREDRGSSLRFEAVAARGSRQGLDGEDARQTLRKALDHGREVLTAAKARAAVETERQRQAEKLNQGHRLGRGPRLGRRQ